MKKQNIPGSGMKLVEMQPGLLQTGNTGVGSQDIYLRGDKLERIDQITLNTDCTYVDIREP